jgi:hypothetical protein
MSYSQSASGSKDDNIILSSFGAQKTDRIETAQQVFVVKSAMTSFLDLQALNWFAGFYLLLLIFLLSIIN